MGRFWSVKTTTTNGYVRLDIRLFGTPRLSVDGEAFVFRAPAKAMLLLAYVVTARREVMRKPLAFALWPDESEDTALANLRRHLLLLESALPESTQPYLEKTRLWVRWRAGERTSVDATRYEDAVAEASRFEEAVELYAGDFLETSENEWAVAYRQRLRDRQLDVLTLLVARYRTSDPARALDYAERAYRFDPWREDSLCEVMRLRNVRGDRAGAVAEYLDFRRRVRAELAVDPLPQTTAVYAQICATDAHAPSTGVSVATGGSEVATSWHSGSPYCGLRAFDAEHAPVFFGRTAERAEIIRKLLRGADEGQPAVLVLGASGCGKSSLLRAGVVPDLTTRGESATMRKLVPCFLTPADAFRLGALVDARAGPDVRLLVVVDQLEELFTGTPRDRAATFLETLNGLVARGSAWVILAMRSDFYHFISEITWLRSLAERDRTYLLSGLIEHNVGQVIREPAACAGVRFALDPQTGIGLDEVIRRDAEGPGRLPLLEFALDELYLADVVRAGGSELTFATYAALGGLAGAIAGRAREQCADLDPAALESVLLALITLRVAEPPTARTAPGEEFASTPLRVVLDRLVRARLVVASDGPAGGTYRLAHEALLTNWDLAADLIERAAEDLRALARLRAAERVWHDRACDDDFLLPPGKPLAEARALQGAGRILSPELNAFVDASAARSELFNREHETEVLERKRLSRQARVARLIAAVIGTAGLGLMAWGITSAESANRAYSERMFEQAVTADHLTQAWAECGKQRELCIASVERWLNTNMPRISNVSSPLTIDNYSLPAFSVSGCKLEFEKHFTNRRTGQVVERDHESADLTELEAIFHDRRGFNGGSTPPLLPTLIGQTQGFVKRSDAGYKYFYFNFDNPDNEARAERNFRLLADLCSDGLRVF